MKNEWKRGKLVNGWFIVIDLFGDGVFFSLYVSILKDVFFRSL